MRYFLLLILLLSFFVYCPASSGKTSLSTFLIENSSIFDGKLIKYEGEVIGDIMPRGDYAWVNIWDGENSIGIWGKKEDFAEIKYQGSYKYVGDRIRVIGVFNRECPIHGGDLDIHARKIFIVEKGYKVARPISAPKVITITVLLIVFGGLFLFRKFFTSKTIIP